MLVKCGSVANSPFRVSAYMNSMNKALNSSAVVALRSVYVHYVQLTPSSSLDSSPERQQIVDQILSYDSSVPADDALGQALVNAVSAEPGSAISLPEGCYLLHVVPRKGTISPWSSKATNIFINCGFNADIERVERGTAFLVKVRKGFPFEQYLESAAFLDTLHDRMTQTVHLTNLTDLQLFESGDPRPLVSVPRNTIAEANKQLGLALDNAEVTYLNNVFPHRDPTDVELFMFAQVNSEHCRHKIFNADWKIDGEQKAKSLFRLIRDTNTANPNYTVSAYSDNAAVLEGSQGYFYAPDPKTNAYTLLKEKVHFLAKVETHNHPTAVSPFPGAATGSGGEIRDECAVGRGSKSKAGLVGFATGDLLLPDFKQPWELDVGKPNHISSALDIMLDAPIGGAAFNNELGRPALAGYFRTLTTNVPSASGKIETRGYHKPIMLAGGLGVVRPQFALKDKRISPGAALIVLGGPAMLIGLGGGAASSVNSGESSADLDFASVQRGNPEMQRRAQQVIESCVALGDENPIVFIHDVGAGGLSNAFTELIHDNDVGGIFDIRKVPCVDSSMSPMEIWCCEAQERFVLAVNADEVKRFEEICQRERAIYGIVGEATAEEHLLVNDSLLGSTPVDLDLSVLFGKPPKLSRSSTTKRAKFEPFNATGSFAGCLDLVLALPSVASKSFLVTIGDRSITGLVARDQFVGPWQTPVADVAVSITSYGSGVITGEAFAMGERPSVALVSPAASSRISVAESLLNLFAADIRSLDEVRLSANWMASPNYEEDGADLYEAVQALSEFCIPLGVSVPVGKDSMSMSMKWEKKQVTSPVSVVVSAFGPVADVRKTWTPRLVRDAQYKLVYVNLSQESKPSLGGSAFAQVHKQVGNTIPDVSSSKLRSLLQAMIVLHQQDVVTAYHDVSDGGIITTLLEMAFAGRTGLQVSTEMAAFDLFSEEPGAVFQVKDVQSFKSVLFNLGLPPNSIVEIATIDIAKSQPISVLADNTLVLQSTRAKLQQQWSQVSSHMQRLRDNPQCADQELANIADDADPGLNYKLTFDLEEPQTSDSRPKVAILREQGVNGHVEMSYSFHRAGFEAIDVHMSDLAAKRYDLKDFRGFVACGGFSYGDVLGAGNGWASSVLYNPDLKTMFSDFFQRKDTFVLGVCNGCQFLSRLKSIIPGCENWPSFERNQSEQFEGRTSTVEIIGDDSSSPSAFLKGMRGSRLPVAVAHGEGRVSFESDQQQQAFLQEDLVVLRYVDNYGKATERYPFNPNGSIQGITGIRSPDGRVLALMPHPERTTIGAAGSFPMDNQREDGPWMRMFSSVYEWATSI